MARTAAAAVAEHTASTRLRDAHTTLATAAHERDAAQALARAYRAVLNQSTDGETVDVLARLDAEQHRTTAEIELLRTEHRVIQATRAVDAARDAERQEIALEFHQPLRDAIKALRVALIAAAAANATVQKVQMAQHERDGLPFEVYSWPEFDIRLDVWADVLKRAGLLDD